MPQGWVGQDFCKKATACNSKRDSGNQAMENPCAWTLGWSLLYSAPQCRDTAKDCPQQKHEPGSRMECKRNKQRAKRVAQRDPERQSCPSTIHERGKTTDAQRSSCSKVAGVVSICSQAEVLLGRDGHHVAGSAPEKAPLAEHPV